MMHTRMWRRLLPLALLIVVCVAACPPSARSQAPPPYTITLLHGFLFADLTDGSGPRTPLVAGGDGDFYGAAIAGGIMNSNAGVLGNGVVFKLTPQGEETTLYRFTGGADGRYPTSLVRGSDGNFYGTTVYGGNLQDSGGGSYGYGVVFKVTPRGEETTLYAFAGGADGACPTASLVEAPDGSFYGATSEGGANGFGTVFRITPSGILTTLNSFSGTNGSYPYALTLGRDGFLYGVTIDGGGTVFKMSTAGVLTTLYAFSGSDGAGPCCLIQGSDGAFYGATWDGGYMDGDNPGGSGTVFRITSSGALTALHAFTGDVDGASPRGLLQGADGNLYGAAFSGGDLNGQFGAGEGTVFEITPSGAFTVLHVFSDADAPNPLEALTQGSDGALYGVADGTIYRLSARPRFDMTGSGNNDLLWRDTADGRLDYWLMFGAVQTSSGAVTPTECSDWQVVAQPDLNGDGVPDLVWQNIKTGDVTYWLMNGTQFTGTWGYLVRGLPTAWKVVASAAMDADAWPGLIFQNTQTGDVTYLRIVNQQFTGTWAYLSQGVSPDWQIIGAADLFNDGNNALVWWDSKTGDVTYWKMSGTTYTGTWGYIAKGVSTDWRAVGMSDLTGDGLPDLVWQNTCTGDVSYLQVIDAQFTGRWGYLAQGISPGWQLTGMR